MVHAQLAHIQEIQSDEWWRDITVPMLEQTRKRLRLLVKLIEKRQRKPIYTDFEDELGGEETIELSVFTESNEFERFRTKARAFLSKHESHIAIQKLRLNQPLPKMDLQELERMLAASGVGSVADVAKAKSKNKGLGIFVRSLVGFDRESAKRAFSGFLALTYLSANQIEFINMVIDHLTAQGFMDASLLYESPFTDLSPQGPEGLFSPEQVGALLSILEEVRSRALG